MTAPEPSPSVSVSRELLTDATQVLDDCAETLHAHGLAADLVEAGDSVLSFLRLALTQPQPEAPAPANPLAGWTDLHVAGDWLSGRPPNAQAMQAIAQVRLPAPALPAERDFAAERRALEAELDRYDTLRRQHDTGLNLVDEKRSYAYLMLCDVTEKRLRLLRVEEAQLGRLRALAGAEAGEDGPPTR